MAKTPMRIDKALEVCELIAEGDSVANACKELKTDARAFYRALATENEQLTQSYMRARKSRADARAERIDEIMSRMELAKTNPRYIDPNTARVMIDAIKWQAGKENNSRYGDKIVVDVTPPKPLLNRQQQLEQIQASGLDLVEVAGVWAIPVTPVPVEEAETEKSTQTEEIEELTDV